MYGLIWVVLLFLRIGALEQYDYFEQYPWNPLGLGAGRDGARSTARVRVAERAPGPLIIIICNLMNWNDIYLIIHRVPLIITMFDCCFIQGHGGRARAADPRRRGAARSRHRRQRCGIIILLLLLIIIIMIILIFIVILLLIITS